MTFSLLLWQARLSRAFPLEQQEPLAQNWRNNIWKARYEYKILKINHI